MLHWLKRNGAYYTDSISSVVLPHPNPSPEGRGFWTRMVLAPPFGGGVGVG